MRNEKGAFLISSYLVLSVIGTFSLFVFLKNATVYWASERTRSQITAFHLAESAVDQAITRLRSDLSYAGQGYTAFGGGGYEVQVTTPDPLLNPTLKQIVATGHAPDNSAASYAYSRRQITTHVNFTPSNTGNYALFSETSINVAGSATVDSYDSQRGAYEAQVPGSNGDLGTNSTGAGMVSLAGVATIRGDVVVGPGGDPSRVIRTSPGVTIEGSRTAATSVNTLDLVVLPPNCVNQGSLSLAGSGTTTLPGGTYCYSSVTLSGSVRLRFTGPSTVYVTEGLTAAGSARITTTSSTPSDLRIMVQGTRDLTLAGSSQLYGILYAPRADITVAGSGQIFGSITGKSIVQAGSSQIHFDESLNRNAQANTTYQSHLLAWIETA